MLPPVRGSGRRADRRPRAARALSVGTPPSSQAYDAPVSATPALAEAIRSVAAAASQDPTAVLDQLALQAEALLGCDGVSVHLVRSRDGEVVLQPVRLSDRQRGVPPDSTWRADPVVLAALRDGRVAFHERFQA